MFSIESRVVMPRCCVVAPIGVKQHARSINRFVHASWLAGTNDMFIQA
jgi:hypothetical protein